ncbi:alpha/beta hydrolase [Planctomonas sp. JC2975]|uniref:alpha/beta fold hydrolase n=1 Tax=Planctomonas sp. JC2975 TaxID=2729626 RepID=UPI0014751F13|nr:alpha/beta hydrolase [Planctomonas sp. JC2975]NNC14041.1 alpha/beta hydrolase [Planctomonas sp. JC2975]
MIVAIPGTLCAPDVFEPIAEALAGDARVEPVDWMLAPGPWDIPTIAQRILERVRTDHTSPIVVLGHSTGGAIALQIALSAPEIVSALIISDSGPNMKGHGDVSTIIAAAEISWGPQLFAPILTRSFREPLPHEVERKLLAYAGRVSPTAVIEVLRSQRDLDFAEHLTDLAVPTLVLHGSDDPVRTINQAQAFSRALPDAVLQIIDSGHTPVFEAPHETAAAIRSFLRNLRIQPRA